MKKQVRAMGLLGLVVTLSIITSGQVAVASDRQEASPDGRQSLPSVAVDNADDELSVLTQIPQGASQNLVPERTRVALSDLQMSPLMADITELEWRAEDRTVVLYVFQPGRVKKDLVALFPADQRVELVASKMDRATMEATAEAIASESASLYGDEDAVTYVAPARDASSFRVGVRPDTAQRKGVSNLPDSFRGEVLINEVDHGVAPATRVRSTAPVVTGGAFRGEAVAAPRAFQ